MSKEISPSTVHRRLKTLRAKGMIMLVNDTTDSRTKYVMPTPLATTSSSTRSASAWTLRVRPEPARNRIGLAARLRREPGGFFLRPCRARRRAGFDRGGSGINCQIESTDPA